MNDDQSPFQIHPDDHLEARITAYVLGEASPFEAAELEELIAKSPELQLFLTRTRTLHTLLTEAETTSNTPSEDWKLPESKRHKVARLMDNPLPVPALLPEKRNNRRILAITAFSIAASILFAAFLLTLTKPEFLERKLLALNEANQLTQPEAAGPTREQRITSINELKKAVREMEDRVEERRKVLTTISRTKDIVYYDNDARFLDGRSQLDADQEASFSRNMYNDLEGKKVQLETQIESLLKYDSEQLLIYASGLDLPDNNIKSIYPQYLELKRQINGLEASGLGEEHPTVVANQKVFNSMKKDLDEGVINLRTQLQGQLETTKDSLAKVEIKKDESKRDALERSIDTQDYVDAKRSFETDQKLLEQMKLKLIEAEIASRLSDQDQGEVASMPSAPNSSLGNVIAANTTSPSGVPVPSEESAPADFGAGADFGDGWGDKKQLAKNDKAKESDRRDESQSAAPAKQERQLAANEPSSRSRSLGGFEREGSSKAKASKDDSLAEADAFAMPGPTVSDLNEAPQLPQPAAEPTAPASPLAAADIDALASGKRQKQELEYLDDPIRTNPSLNHDQSKKVDEVRRKLYMAQGNFDLGKYDDAKKAYEDTLRLDPYNSAARRGMEKIAAAKSDYYRAAYDHTRAELLMQVDNAWELSIPGSAELEEMDLKAAEIRLQNLKKQLEEPAINESKKQALFQEWSKLNNQLLKRNADFSPQPPVIISEEIPAAQDSFSTFSLNISDASFQIALAAIEKGEQPDPSAIKPEQFYNAVDYADPAPSSSEPVAAAIDQTAHPVIPGRNLVRVALRTASTGRSPAQSLRLTLLVDQSGSMVRADRRAAMEKALAQLSTLLTANDQITVIGFSRTPRLLADSLPGNQSAKLPDLINQTANEGGTNLEQAINLASELALRHKLPGAQNRIVLFTDGAANLGNADPDRLSKKIETLRQQGLAFDIAGIGTNDLNDNLLAELARHGNGRYYLVGENTGTSFATQLAGAFRPAAENVKVQVRLNPERVGNYKLIGFEKDRLKTEDFRNDSIDAAELAADEAGVAIYQVEPLPQGSGEIGEVSVRFRDTASGEMVERTWTIPYDPATPAFDKAAPQTQLATLSLLAAQKLQGGPLAEAINFRTYAPTIARLKQTYANDPKAQRMITLVNALK